MMAKRLLGMMLVSVLSIFTAKAQDLVYDGITPAPGSEISSFDFVLKFDLSKVIEANGPGEYGVGWVGYHNDKRPQKEESVTIYKGDPADKIVIGRCCDDYYNGGDADFVPSSEVKISVPGAIPEPGVTYTIVISNEFEVYTKANGAKPYPNSYIDFFSSPITYIFTGAAVLGEKLSVAGCSVTANQSIDVLNEVIFSFSQPVSVNTAYPLVVKENDAVYATSVGAVLSEDKTEVTYKFDNASLLNGHSYVISLPADAVTSVSSSETNAEFNVTVTGSYVGHFELKSSIPTSEQKTLFSTIEGIFEMPDGFNIYVKPPYTLNLYGYLYKNEVSEENLVGRLNGEINSAKNGIIWTNTYSLDPEATYVLNKPADEFRANDIATDKASNEWYNGEVNIVLNTPSIAESGIPQLSFRNPVNGKYGSKSATELLPGSKVEYIGTLELGLNDYVYKYEGQSYNPRLMGDNANVYVYDITDGKETLVRKEPLTTRQVDEDDWRIPLYNVWSAGINTYLLSGHKYRIVIPAGAMTVNCRPIMNYVSPEWSIELEGDAPAEVSLESCSLENNAELSELANVVWVFKGSYLQDANKFITIHWKSSIGGLTDNCITTVSNYANQTVVTAYLPAASTGGAYQFNTNRQYEITFPEGFLYYAGDPSIKNSEMVYNIIPVAKTPEVVKPEFVNLTVEVNGIATIAQKAVKGETATIALTPTEDWKVESVEGANQSGNSLITPALASDSTVKVELAYAGTWAEELSTNVWEIENTSIQISEDGGMIVVSGVTPENTINVYNVAGMFINSAHTTDAYDTVRISVAQGQTYIVTVDGVAAKIYIKK